MADDVEARREAIERELVQLGLHHGMPDAETQRRRNQRIAELQAELRALPQKPKPKLTGKYAGMESVIIDGRLGSGFHRPERQDDGSEYERWYDPFENSPTARRE